MKREVFIIENGIMEQNNTFIFKDLSLQLFAGEIVGLAFDNLTELRFFLKLLKGEQMLTSGRICLDEEELFESAAKKLSKYTAVISRKSGLISSVSIEDNIFLFADKSWFISRKNYRERFSKLREKFGILYNLPDKQSELSMKERIMIELLKAYADSKKIIVLKDVIGALTKSETEELFEFIVQIKDEMTFVVIAGFDEVNLQHLNRMVLVQSGRTIAMSQLMIQKKGLSQILQVLINESEKPDKLMTHFPMAAEKERKMMLQASNVITEYLKNFNLTLESGELQKLYYSDDRTKEHLWGIFTGETRIKSGELFLGQEKYKVNNMAEAVLKGIGFIVERPYQHELLENITAIENISMPLQEKVHGFWIFKKYKQSVEEYIREMHLEQKKIRNMSSLERQKMVYEKWLLYMPKVLICHNPFADIDINMQELTLKMIKVLQKRGIAILILTSNLYTMHKIPGKSLYYYQGELMDEADIWEMIGE